MRTIKQVELRVRDTDHGEEYMNITPDTVGQGFVSYDRGMFRDDEEIEISIRVIKRVHPEHLGG